MKTTTGIGLKNVQDVYSGPEGELWELVMGEQIHIGGFQSSMELAKRADIGAGMEGIDLCCCTGAGMRFLVLFRNVKHMTGVDATNHIVSHGQQRCKALDLSDKISFVLADVCSSGLPDKSADFIWGEDAWCYVVDKQTLIAEAARIVKPGGVIAFTDWIEGPHEMTQDEGQRLLAFMKFPNIQDLNGYKSFLENNGCSVSVAEYTDRFAPYMDLYLDMLNKQLTYDALRIIGFDMPLMESMGKEMVFMRNLAHEHKISQAIFIAQKKS